MNCFAQTGSQCTLPLICQLLFCFPPRLLLGLGVIQSWWHIYTYIYTWGQAMVYPLPSPSELTSSSQEVLGVSQGIGLGPEHPAVTGLLAPGSFVWRLRASGQQPGALYADRGWSAIRTGLAAECFEDRSLNLINTPIVFPNLVAADWVVPTDKMTFRFNRSSASDKGGEPGPPRSSRSKRQAVFLGTASRGFEAGFVSRIKATCCLGTVELIGCGHLC